MKLEILHVPDCPNLGPMLDRLRQATDLPVTTRVIDNDADAARYGMAGSPTLLIDGTDPFASTDEAGQCACSVSCRLYHDETGKIIPAPSVQQVQAAIGAAAQDQPNTPAGVLSAWRQRAVSMEPTEKDALQAILRSFATAGRPPTPRELAATVAESHESTAAALEALHAADAIRLSPDGKVAVAYPFSSTQTRHRVRIGNPSDRVDVYAMCAIDALGIAPMLATDTRIDSVDTMTGRPITVTTNQGHSHWEPASAVVFVGADAGEGPSADCCCDYLNFFADLQTAQRWTTAHPHTPGQILNQADAKALASRLFDHLLAT